MNQLLIQVHGSTLTLPNPELLTDLVVASLRACDVQTSEVSVIQVTSIATTKRRVRKLKSTQTTTL